MISSGSLGARGAVAAIIVLFFVLAQPPSVSQDERAKLGAAMSFKSLILEPASRDGLTRTVRNVNPALQNIKGWISAVGAAVALADIDGDGLPNDYCMVDPRNDTVTVAPVPGTGRRFDRFLLEHDHPGYDPQTIAPMGCLAGDLNEDGISDFVVYYWGRTPLAYIAAAAQPSAGSYAVQEIMTERERWFSNAGLFADIDGDGHADLLIGNYFADGDRILDVRARDGGAMQHSMSRARNGGRNRVLLWQGAEGRTVRYADASDSLPASSNTGWTLAMAAADIDGDLKPELYVSNDFGSDRLYHNLSEPGRPQFRLAQGSRGFLTTRSGVLGRDSFKGMGADFGDVNGDGLPDLVVSNIAQPYALHEHHFLYVHTGDSGRLADGWAPYINESARRGIARSGWGWDVKFVDFDNNGTPEIVQAIGFLKGGVNRWPELQELAMTNDELVANPAFWAQFAGNADISGRDYDRFFVADNSGHYWDLAETLGVAEEGISRGVAIADVDGDGRLDVAIARQWMPSRFLRNRSDGGSFLSLDLRFANPNGTSRPAVGASIAVKLQPDRVRTANIDGGGGHSGKNAPVAHFGLGMTRSDEPLPVRVSWRTDGKVVVRDFTLTPGQHRIVLNSTDGAESL